MNLLYVSHCNGIEGGAAKSSLRLMEEMQEKGVQIYVLVPNRSARFTYEYRIRGIRTIGANYDWWLRKDISDNRFEKCKCLIQYYKEAKRIAETVKKLKIDIIHSNSSVISIGGLVSKYSGLPHVWHIREFGKEDFDLDWYFDRKYSISFMNKFSSKIIVVSESLREKYNRYFGDKLVVIHNGISKEYINPKRKETSNDIAVISIAGMIMPGKGQMEAILAINELVKTGYTNVRLNVIGEVHDRTYEHELKKVIAENNLEGYIQFLGFISDLRQLRQSSIVELICSKKEAYARIVMEAMFSMNPVIGADSGGTSEQIIDGYNGLLYKSGNHKDLADKIKYLIDNPEQIKFMGKNAFEYALKNFTAEKNAKEIYKLYNTILNSDTNMLKQ